jgi:hypothetical protein
LKDDGNVKGNGSEMRDDMGANDGEDRVAIPVESARNVDICCMDVKSDGWYGYVLIIGEHKATLQQRSNDESAMMPLEHTILGWYSPIMPGEIETVEEQIKRQRSV